MRIRITRPRSGEIDGVELATFQVGVTYDVSPSLGTYLVTTASADLVGSEEAALVTPLSEQRIFAASERFGRAVAADFGRIAKRSRAAFASLEPSEVQ